MAVFTLILLIYECGKSFHLLVSSSNSFLDIFKCLFYMFPTCLVSYFQAGVYLRASPPSKYSVLAGPLPARRKVIFIIIIALPAKYTSAAVAQMSWEQPTTVWLDLRPAHEMDPCVTLLR